MKTKVKKIIEKRTRIDYNKILSLSTKNISKERKNALYIRLFEFNEFLCTMKETELTVDDIEKLVNENKDRLLQMLRKRN